MIERKDIGLRDVRHMEAGQMLWDKAVRGFGARRQKSAAVSYVLFYRTKEGRQRFHTIGRHGAPWTPDTARKEARRLLVDVERGKDPAGEKSAIRKAETVNELCDKYWEDAKAGRLLTRRKIAKKDSTLATDKGRIERHIKPLLGRLKVASVTREDIEQFMHDVAEGKTALRVKSGKKRGLAYVRGGKGAASRTVGLLGAIFTYAVRHNMRPNNPVHGVTRFADGKRERRLSEEEYQMLGKALQQAEIDQIWPAAIAATKFLALTGWRSGEALNLKWKEIDLIRRTATLPDTKTGRSVRPLSNAACDLLRGLTRGLDHALVFPASRGDGSMAGFTRFWKQIAGKGNLPSDITPHVLRHSFGSLGGDLGYSELTIAAMIGHKGHSVTSRYVHAADSVLLAAVDAVAERTFELMGALRSKAVIIPLNRLLA